MEQLCVTFLLRKRKKGGLKLEQGGVDTPDYPKHVTAAEEKARSVSTEINEEQHQQKKDDLWASFLSDVGPRPKFIQTTCLPQVGDPLFLKRIY